ncbi:glutathione synthase [Hygrophoropsis aurantiaca]|uniref:Glutathione synthase n=1 Tax=Hygrophoropsis aurantiaca TaxID=72124 RepID=A0ACB8A8R1_9AGAM|nr:glutathione synthase [Hygrophoropsis aurantiaca]
MTSQSLTFDFAEWPPALTESQLEELTLAATTYALSHGLLYLPPVAPNTNLPPIPTSAIHAPISLVPSPVPRHLFNDAKALQSAYNTLYARVAMDEEFLDKVMGAVEGVGRADDFVGTLWKGWKAVRDEGIAQPLQLGLFRSDYLLHTGEGPGLSLKQVEFNTISSSFGPLSERTAAMHRHLHAFTNYYGASPYFKAKNFPPNNTVAGLAEGLAEAHKAYGISGSQILFVVQPNERNVFDQRWLEYELLERHSIRVVRQTFAELAESAVIDPTTRVLRIVSPSPSARGTSEGIEISTVYFRAGYVPTDLPTPTHYATRIALERSRAIKCPSIPLQLAGGKKVQEVLAKPGVLERFLGSESKDTLEDMRKTWMGMWALDDKDPSSTSSTIAAAADVGITANIVKEPLGTLKARQQHASLVLKPQREGGGNNVYKEDIPAFLDRLPDAEREAWIAMELIVPPEQTGSYLVRAGGGAPPPGESTKSEARVKTEVISELGIFGWALFGDGDINGEKEVGWLVRTKGKESNEGGVAAGFSVLDSVLLVD